MSSGRPNPFYFQPSTPLLPSEFDEHFTVILTQTLNDLAISLNAKDTALYLTTEIATGGLFIPTFPAAPLASTINCQNRPMFRVVVDFGALPNNATKSVAHGITTTQNWSLVKLNGTATDPGATTMTLGVPIPYASSTAADIIELNMDATNIIITTGVDRTAFTRTFVVIEYITTV